MSINKNKTGLTFGFLIAFMHLLWSVLVKRLGVKTVFFEWPLSWNRLLKTLIRGSRTNETLKEFQKLSDGRISKDHLELLDFLYKKKIKVFCIDGDNLVKNWNAKDKSVAQNIKKTTTSRALPCLIVLGNLHARKNNFEYQKQKFIPAGSYFKKQGVFVLIGYGSGTIYNFGLEKIMDKEILKKLNKQQDYRLLLSKNKYFDYEILVRKTEPVKSINS